MTGRLIDDTPEEKPPMTGNQRTYRVWLDTRQYQEDMTSALAGKEVSQGGWEGRGGVDGSRGGERRGDLIHASTTQDVYECFNVMMRRKPKENNFKAVLSTIRDLMNTDCVVPDWLHDIILGYGDPASAHYSKLVFI